MRFAYLNNQLYNEFKDFYAINSKKYVHHFKNFEDIHIRNNQEVLKLILFSKDNYILIILNNFYNFRIKRNFFKTNRKINKFLIL